MDTKAKLFCASYPGLAQEYLRFRDKGQSHNMAEMFATRETPSFKVRQPMRSPFLSDCVGRDVIVSSKADEERQVKKLRAEGHEIHKISDAIDDARKNLEERRKPVDTSDFYKAWEETA